MLPYSMQLNSENYQQGFLVDDEFLAGVTQDPDHPELFMGYVLNHVTGEYLGCHSFKSLEEALEAVNAMPRSWEFQKTNPCGGGCGGHDSEHEGGEEGHSHEGGCGGCGGGTCH